MAGRARIIAVFAGALGVGAALLGAAARAEGPDAFEGRKWALSKGQSTSPSRNDVGGDAVACPDGMTLVEGEYCPRVEQRCLRWLDPPGRYHQYRCAEYAKPARCLSARRHERFCIDRHERAEDGTGLPLNVQSWSDAKRTCEAAGARVCGESEWNFACEGEEMRPYPYGFKREATRCNADKLDLIATREPWKLRDERDPAGSHPACSSPFGVLDMAGNVAEWVSVDGVPEGTVVVQKGNWWQPGKHACRDAQGGHDRYYKGTETGFRCCAAAAAR
jgi:hypothetical protein